MAYRRYRVQVIWSIILEPFRYATNIISEYVTAIGDGSFSFLKLPIYTEYNSTVSQIFSMELESILPINRASNLLHLADLRLYLINAYPQGFMVSVPDVALTATHGTVTRNKNLMVSPCCKT